MSGIYIVYTWYIPGISCPTVNHAFWEIWVLSRSCPENPCHIHVFPIYPVLIASLIAWKTKRSLKLVYVLHIPCIYIVYVMYMPGMFGTYFKRRIMLSYTFLGFNIILSWTMALVCHIELHINTWKWNFDIYCIHVVYARHILQQYIYMEYTWYIPTIYLVWVPDVGWSKTWAEFETKPGIFQG